MRSAQKSNRSRGRGNRKGGGGGGNIVNRVYDSAGPEGKVRGTPQQIIDKYQSLARDAQTMGDRVMSENFLQHAEHYQRMLIQAAAAQEQNRREQSDQGDFDGDGQDGQQHQHGQQHQPERRAEQQAEPQQRESEADGADEIGGMTMIDSGRDSDELLVAEEIGQGRPPRRNGDGRRRRPRRSDEDGAESAPEAQDRSHQDG